MRRELSAPLFLALSALFAAFSAAAGAASAEDTDVRGADRTWRLDYYHTGRAGTQTFSLDRVVVEPLPWPGPPDRRLDTTGFGRYRFEVVAADGTVVYSRGFASIYGEWVTTEEAAEQARTFHESLRFPAPAGPVTVRLYERDAANVFHEVWATAVDPADMFIETAPPPRQEVVEIEVHGAPRDKLDVLLLGDGYTAGECAGKFRTDARRLAEVLFAHAPFRERREAFNVWGLCPPAAESGISRPSTGIHRRSLVGATYDAFGSERYVLTFENRAWRDIAAWAPYELVEILVNGETYGGGGIFNLFATVAVDNAWAEYVFIHEFGHHMAGLADEYYTSAVAYEVPAEPVEPWEPNATTDPLHPKWADLVGEGVPVPTPWPKEAFEEHARGIQERRRQIRAERRPEAEMEALFREQQVFETRLLGESEHAGAIGAFEGANYAPKGYYRPAVDCIMFTRDPVPFCAVCRRALERVIDLYAP